MEQDSIKFFTEERQRATEKSEKIARFMQTDRFAAMSDTDKRKVEKQKLSADMQIDMLTKIVEGDTEKLNVLEVFATILVAHLVNPPFGGVEIEEC